MLNPFPSLLVYGFFAPLLIRVAVGMALFYMAVRHHRSRKEIAHLVSPLVGKTSRVSAPFLVILELLSGLLLIIGLYTQFAALLGMLLALKGMLIRKKLTAIAPLSHAAYALLIVMCISLLITGAGGFAFDLPL